MGIEPGYFSILRGLAATGTIREELETHGCWRLIVVSDYAFFAAIQAGVTMRKTMEIPLSSSEEVDSSIVQEIQQDFETFIEGEPPAKLVIVNNAGRLRTEDLLTGLGLHGPGNHGEVTLIEQNAETLTSRGAQGSRFHVRWRGSAGCSTPLFLKSPG